MNVFQALKTALAKLSFRDETKRKAEKIFNQGGVNFLSVVPNEDIDRATWEFDVNSTSGETYPVYLDTTTDNPDNSLGWDDIICGCDWSKWNYDRAPEYDHLSDLYCSHALAVDMWLERNGQKEHDRAVREEESGQTEIPFEDETRGPRRRRPKERVIMDRAEEEGTTQREQRDILNQQDQENTRNLYDQQDPSEQMEIEETPPGEPIEGEDPLAQPEQQEPDLSPRPFRKEYEDEPLRPRLPSSQDQEPIEEEFEESEIIDEYDSTITDEFSGEEYEDDYEERNVRRRRNSSWSGPPSWWSTPNTYSEARTGAYDPFRKSSEWYYYNSEDGEEYGEIFIITPDGDIHVSGKDMAHLSFAQQMGLDQDMIDESLRGFPNGDELYLMPFDPNLEGFTEEQVQAAAEAAEDNIDAKVLLTGNRYEEFEGSIDDGISWMREYKVTEDVYGIFKESDSDHMERSFESISANGKGIITPEGEVYWWAGKSFNYHHISVLSYLEEQKRGERIDLDWEGFFSLGYMTIVGAGDYVTITGWDSSESEYDSEERAVVFIYKAEGLVSSWEVVFLGTENGDYEMYTEEGDLAEVIEELDPMGMMRLGSKQGTLKKQSSIQDEYLWVVNTQGDYVLRTEGYHPDLAGEIPDDGNKEMWVRGAFDITGGFMVPFSPRMESNGELTTAQRETCSDILQDIRSAFLQEGLEDGDFSLIPFDIEFPDEKFTGSFIDAVSYLGSESQLVGSLKVW